MNYNSYQLQEVCSFIDYRGKTPPKTSHGIPLITAKIVKGGKILPPTEFIADEYYDEWMRRGIPRKGAVLFTTEAPLGEVAQITTDEKLAFAQRIIILQADESRLCNDYLLYALQHGTLRNRILSKATGTTVTGIKAAELKTVVIDLPPLSVQKRIASICKSLDSKIAINEKINDNLLQQLQAIYQAKFGRNTAASASLGHLSDICHYSQRRIAVTNLSLETYYSTENMLPEKAGAVRASSLPTTAQAVGCIPGDVLVSNIRPYFKKILYCSVLCGCSNDVLCFEPSNAELSAFLFGTLYDDRFFDYMVAGSKGTKMPRGDKQQIMAYPIVVPAIDKLSAFNEIARPILAKVEALKAENKRLSELRDTLLPRLFSGEIDVSSVSV